MPSIEISDRAFAYLKGRAEPFVDTPLSVLDRILFEKPHQPLTLAPTNQGATLMFTGTSAPPVKFAIIRSAILSGQKAVKNTWNHLLEDMITHCCKKGAPSQTVREALKANTADGEVSENGFRYVSAAGFSFQGLEANRVCENIITLAEKFGVPFEIEIQWSLEEGAAHPGAVALLRHS